MASTLWIGNLEEYMDEDFLMQAFNTVGETLLNCKLIKDKITGEPLGYGFIDFSDENKAAHALEHLNGKTVPLSNPPKKFLLNYAGRKRQTDQQNDLSMYVGDLSSEITDDHLLQVFTMKYPSVQTAKVVMDNTGGSRGFGFVKFSDNGEFQRALEEMQNVTIGSKPIRVNIATRKKPQNNVYYQQQSPMEQASGSNPRWNYYGPQSYYQNSY